MKHLLLIGLITIAQLGIIQASLLKVKNTTGTTISIRWKYRNKEWKGPQEILQDKSLNFINIAKLEGIQLTGVPLEPCDVTVQATGESRTVTAEVCALSLLKTMAQKNKRNVRMRLIWPKDKNFVHIGMGLME